MDYKLYYSQSMQFFGIRTEKLFGFQKYDPAKDRYRPVLFSGLYHPGDYTAFEYHLGRKAIFWHGTDVQILAQNSEYQNLIKKSGRIRHACQTKQLQKELKKLGIQSKVRPTFFGDIKDYPVSYKHKDKPEVYLSMHPGREKEYGLDIIERIAPQVPNIKFHIYGINRTNTKNIIFHGQIPEEQMDKEIKNYQSCLRLNKHDGLSQCVIKSILLGQWPITKIPYELISNAPTEEHLIIQLNQLRYIPKSRTTARDYYLPKLSNFDWLEPEKEGLSLVMMVKNEEKGLKKAIESCKNFINEIVISVDQASTDKTYNIAKKHADILLTHKWESDFSKVRNFVQEYATRK